MRQNLVRDGMALCQAWYRAVPLSTGKRERYQPRTERTVVAFNAVDDAEITQQPVTVRLVARAIAGSKPGAIIARKEIPLMVVAKP